MDRKTLESRREQVLEEMRAIRTMRAGSVSEQFLKVRHSGKDEPVARGPYFLWQYYEKGKPVRKRLSASEAPKAAEEVKNYKRFKQLSEEFCALTQQLTLHAQGDAPASEEAVKKKPKSRSRKATK